MQKQQLYCLLIVCNKFNWALNDEVNKIAEIFKKYESGFVIGDSYSYSFDKFSNAIYFAFEIIKRISKGHQNYPNKDFNIYPRIYISLSDQIDRFNDIENNKYWEKDIKDFIPQNTIFISESVFKETKNISEINERYFFKKKKKDENYYLVYKRYIVNKLLIKVFNRIFKSFYFIYKKAKNNPLISFLFLIFISFLGSYINDLWKEGFKDIKNIDYQNQHNITSNKKNNENKKDEGSEKKLKVDIKETKDLIQQTCTGDAMFPTFSPDGKSFAYYSNKAIWIKDLINEETKKVFDIEECSCLRWSPIKNELLACGKRDSSYGIYIFSPNKKEVFTRLDYFPLACWSPDGSMVASCNYNGINILFMKINLSKKSEGDQNDKRYIDLDTSSFNFITDIDWSPKSGLLLFLTNNEDKLGDKTKFSGLTIWSIKIDGKDQKMIKNIQIHNNDGFAKNPILFSPRWSEDGENIFYLQNRDDYGAIYDYSVIISIKLEKIVNEEKYPESFIPSKLSKESFYFSKSGKNLLYVNKGSYLVPYILKITNIHGSYKVDVDKFPKEISYGKSIKDIRISPDSDKFIFYVENSDSTNIFLYNSKNDKNKIKQLTNFDNYYCKSPVWSSDGKYIAFLYMEKERDDSIFIIDPENFNVKFKIKTKPWDSNLLLSWFPASNILLFDNKSEISKRFKIIEPLDDYNKDIVFKSLSWRGQITSLCRSHDGKKIAISSTSGGYPSEYNGLFIISLENQPNKQISEKTGFYIIAWSEDDECIYASDVRSQDKIEGQRKLLKISAKTGKEEFAVDLPSYEFLYIFDKFPNKEQFTFVKLEEQSDIWLYKNINLEKN